MSDIVVAFIGAFACAFGVVLGLCVDQDSWSSDCKMLGVHRVGNTVYECKIKEQRNE